jgi:mannitol 2-dehydrogenase
MRKLTTLKENSIHSLRGDIRRPLYDRSRVEVGIVHIGVGGFHRAHQAWYTNALMNRGQAHEWAICGIGLREADRKMHSVLKSQDCLYSLVEKHSDGHVDVSIIGSIVDFILAVDDQRAAIKRMAHPDTKIVSLTITEGGYNFTHAGEFNFQNPDVQWDLAHIDRPKTVFGFLAAALKIRREKGLPAFAIQSCDNIEHNGDVIKKMLIAFVSRYDELLSRWIESHVSFPNSMVDRITPVTSAADIEALKVSHAIDDGWPVVCEPFTQWVVEDKFLNGRPAWESVGAQFVPDVAPYERMKIRLLNASHSLLGLLGTLMGFRTIDEAIADVRLERFVRAFMDQEVTPILGEIPGIDLEYYKVTLIERFKNKFIRDTLARICSESSAKLPKFLLPTIQDQLRNDGPITKSVTVVAAWCRYLELAATESQYQVDDAMKDEIMKLATESAHDPTIFLRNRTVFGNLVDSVRFVEMYNSTINRMRTMGVQHLIEA